MTDRRTTDATSGAQAEAQGIETQTFVWRDHKIEIPASADDWDGDALEFFETGRVASGIRMLIGAARYNEIKAAERAATGRWLTKDIADLGDAIAKAAGFTSAGE